jgi:hypothetical protein
LKFIGAQFTLQGRLTEVPFNPVEIQLWATTFWNPAENENIKINLITSLISSAAEIWL